MHISLLHTSDPRGDVGSSRNRRIASRVYPVLALLLWITAIQPDRASAQNTAGVPGPKVNPEHRALQYRATWDPDLEFFAQRLHYEQALNQRAMLRGIVQSRETSTSNQEFDFVQAELFLELSPEGRRAWSTGLRFDARVRESGSTGLVGLHWLNQFEITESLSTRLVLLNFAQVGGGAESGVFPQTRLSLQQTVGRLGFGVETYSSYGEWTDLADTQDQSHQIGPFVNLGLRNGWSLFGGALFGATDASADTNVRLWLTKTF